MTFNQATKDIYLAKITNQGSIVEQLFNGDRTQFEITLGIPVVWSHIIDGVSSVLPARNFATEFLQAIPVNSNVDTLFQTFLVWCAGQSEYIAPSFELFCNELVNNRTDDVSDLLDLLAQLEGVMTISFNKQSDVYLTQANVVADKVISLII